MEQWAAVVVRPGSIGGWWVVGSGQPTKEVYWGWN